MIPGIQEIKALAIKYSKKQLANMAQTGLIDPQKAVMAGMMRDRIAKEDMQPPTTTVAQDTLGMAPPPQMPQVPQQMGMQPPPQMAQAQGRPSMPQTPPPQMGAPVEQPPVMAASGGVTSLPVDIADYAGGGIVAFGDGGDTSSPLGRAMSGFFGGKTYDPNTTQELQNLDQQFKVLSARDRELSGMFGLQQQTLQQQAEAAEVKRQMNEIWQRSQALKSGTPLATAAPAPAEAAPPAPVPSQVPTAPKDTRGTTGGRGSAPPPPGISLNTKGSAILAQPDLPTDKPFISRPTLPDAPTLAAFDPNKVKIPGEDLPTYTARGRKDIGAARRAAEVEEGIDPDMYGKMIKGVEEKKGKLEKRRGEAGGEALMQFGLGLIGARKGEEFQVASKSGREALGAYKQDVKDLRAAEEKYDERIEALRMSDQQAKLTGVRSDIAQAEQDRQLAFNADVERKRAKNDLAKSSVLAGVQLHGTEAQHKLGVYQAGTRAATDVYQAEQSAASKHFSDLLGAKVQLHTALQQARTAEEGHKIQLQIANLNAQTQQWVHSRPPAEIQAIDIYAKRTGKPFEQAAKDYYAARAGARTMYTREEMMKDARKNLENRGVLNPTDAQMQAEINTIQRTYEGGGGGGSTAGWGQMTVN